MQISGCPTLCPWHSPLPSSIYPGEKNDFFFVSFFYWRSLAIAVDEGGEWGLPQHHPRVQHREELQRASAARHGDLRQSGNTRTGWALTRWRLVNQVRKDPDFKIWNQTPQIQVRLVFKVLHPWSHSKLLLLKCFTRKPFFLMCQIAGMKSKIRKSQFWITTSTKCF